MGQATRRADQLASSFFTKVGAVLRPFEFAFGIVFLLLSLFLVVSLGMTSADKLLQITKQHMNWMTGRRKGWQAGTF